MRDSARAFVESKGFNAAITTIIIFNAIIIGATVQIGTSNPLDNASLLVALNIIDTICLVIYIIEMFVKLYAYHGAYFRDGWNVFDFVIIIVSILPYLAIFTGVSPQVVRVFRVFRVLRVFKLVGMFKSVRIVVETLLRSIPGILSTMLLLIITYFVFAVIGVGLYSTFDPEHFGSLGTTMFTLFQLTTLEGWSDVARGVMEYSPAAWVYFVCFIVIASFIIINIILGVIVGAIESVKDEEDEENEKACANKAATDINAMAASPADNDAVKVELDGVTAAQVDGVTAAELAAEIAALRKQLSDVTELLEKR